MRIDKEIFYDVISGLSDFSLNESLYKNVVEVNKIDGLEFQLDLDWENFCLEMSNELALLVQSKYGKKAIEFWNILAEDFHESNYIFQIHSLVMKNDFSKSSFEQICFDILHIVIYKHLQVNFCIRYEFYEELYIIYKSGYIPVGYEGNYPNGKMVVMKL